jgi:hypothetical protein
MSTPNIIPPMSKQDQYSYYIIMCLFLGIFCVIIYTFYLPITGSYHYINNWILLRSFDSTMSPIITKQKAAELHCLESPTDPICIIEPIVGNPIKKGGSLEPSNDNIQIIQKGGVIDGIIDIALSVSEGLMSLGNINSSVPNKVTDQDYINVAVAAIAIDNENKQKSKESFLGNNITIFKSFIILVLITVAFDKLSWMTFNTAMPTQKFIPFAIVHFGIFLIIILAFYFIFKNIKYIKNVMATIFIIGMLSILPLICYSIYLIWRIEHQNESIWEFLIFILTFRYSSYK